MRLDVRLDWEIAKRGWRRYAAYPWATAAGVFTNTIFGFIQAYVLLAVYRHRTDVGGYRADDAVTYVWLAQALLMTVYVFGWQELALRIRDGSIATDLSRPLDPQRYWLAFDLGRAPYHFLFRGVVPFVVGGLVFRLHYPNVGNALLFVLSLALAVVVSLAFRFLYNLPAFWLLDIRGVLILALTVNLFFSGMIVPIAFFPHWLGQVAQVLPFAAILQTPIDVWLGKHHGWELVGVLALQAAWAGVLLALGRVGLRTATRKLVVQGG
ncbi:MAG TPA: ABC-2 family transporter protein [Gaiellaceae bacterium]|nr:ABC-2 family transporter protein [Gaiellaceae bacterium]